VLSPVFGAVCNMNSLTKKESENFSRTVLERDFLTDYFTKPVFPNFNIAMQFSRFLVGSDAFYVTNYKKVDKFMYRLGYSLDEMLISCTFNMVSCNSDDFELFYDIIYGDCYTFNGRNSKTVKAASRPGTINGLVMEVIIFFQQQY
jgi:hypothetical protein